MAEGCGEAQSLAGLAAGVALEKIFESEPEWQRPFRALKQQLMKLSEQIGFARAARADNDGMQGRLVPREPFGNVMSLFVPFLPEEVASNLAINGNLASFNISLLSIPRTISCYNIPGIAVLFFLSIVLYYFLSPPSTPF